MHRKTCHTLMAIEWQAKTLSCMSIKRNVLAVKKNLPLLVFFVIFFVVEIFGFDVHQLGPLGQVGLVVAMSVCTSVCLSQFFIGPSTHCIVASIPWKNVTLNYLPSDHMISSRQPILASIPWIFLHLTMGHWLLSAHIKSWCLPYAGFFSPKMSNKLSHCVSYD